MKVEKIRDDIYDISGKLEPGQMKWIDFVYQQETIVGSRGKEKKGESFHLTVTVFNRGRNLKLKHFYGSFDFPLGTTDIKDSNIEFTNFNDKGKFHKIFYLREKSIFRK